jgi:hypothetical protein
MGRAESRCLKSSVRGSKLGDGALGVRPSKCSCTRRLTGLILTRLGIEVELAFVEDLAEGAFQVECLTRAELGTALRVVRQYRDLAIGLADASVVLAQRLRTRRIVTFDERAFRNVAPLQGGSFRLLPANHPL